QRLAAAVEETRQAVVPDALGADEVVAAATFLGPRRQDDLDVVQRAAQQPLVARVQRLVDGGLQADDAVGDRRRQLLGQEAGALEQDPAEALALEVDLRRPARRILEPADRRRPVV